MSRNDGRAPDELRPLRIKPGWLKFADGSVLLETGDTRVLCSANLEDRVPRWRKGQGLGWVTAEYQMLPGSTDERTTREVRRGGFSGRSQEIQRLIGRSLRAVTDMTGLGERTVWLDCDVLQADGGTRTAAVTGAFLALALALRGAVEKNKIGRVCLTDMLAAVSVGVVDGEPLLDLDYSEDSRAEVDVNIVRTGAGRFVEVQGTAEGEPFDRERFDAMLDLASGGIDRLVRAQREILGDLAEEIGTP